MNVKSMVLLFSFFIHSLLLTGNPIENPLLTAIRTSNLKVVKELTRQRLRELPKETKSNILNRTILTGNCNILEKLFKGKVLKEEDITQEILLFAEQRKICTNNSKIVDFLKKQQEKKTRKRKREENALERQRKKQKEEHEKCGICWDETTPETGPMQPMKKCPAKNKHKTHVSCFKRWKKESGSSLCIFCRGEEKRKLPAQWEEDLSRDETHRFERENFGLNQEEIMAMIQNRRARSEEEWSTSEEEWEEWDGWL